MKNFVIIALVFSANFSFSQQTADKIEVKNTIDAFFKAFHEQDSVAIKSTVSDEVIMQSIGKNKDGKIKLTTANFHDFLKSIISIPKENTFEEKLTDYIINVDGNMANVWTPYEFWYNGKFSHCGVNNFQLFKEDEHWKIIYIIDTRRRDCAKN
ncbi:nuclear transport factor 2 family protein [Zhouia sp. PK063]|uniref:nuclear transport factor 2 family protein n=1 Tax=Zhouia sp. PK063 TaxID=3373602 RepID=UPI00379EA9B1